MTTRSCAFNLSSFARNAGLATALSILGTTAVSASDGFLDVRHASGAAAASVPRGGFYEVVVGVRAAPDVRFNAALFVLYWTREGVAITDYDWQPPFVTGGPGDFSLDRQPLPLVVTEDTHNAPGSLPDTADVEFGVFDLTNSAGAGELLRVRLRAPTNAKVGSSYLMAALPDLFTKDFRVVDLLPGTVLRVDIVDGVPSADLDGDGVIGASDLGLLMSAWATNGIADLDGSGVVDANDLGMLLAQWTGSQT
jgi:hypothetical protein